MDLSQYVESLRLDLLSAAAAGTEETRRTADLLASALDPAIRMTILEALTTATADVTEALAGVTVEVRMHGREPRIVVTPHEPEAEPAEAEPSPAAGEDAGTARITLRLPESLKARTEDAANRDGVSVNAWLVRAVQAALDRPQRGPSRSGRRITGYARG